MKSAKRQFLAYAFYIVGATNNFFMIYLIGFLGWHSWERNLAGFPLGALIGIIELSILSTAAIYSLILAFRHLKESAKEELKMVKEKKIKGVKILTNEEVVSNA